MKYQAVIFDLYGTLVENFPSSKGNEVLRRAAAALGVSPADFISQWSAAYAERMNGTTKNFQACIINICQRLGVKPTEEQIETAAGIKREMTRQEVTSSLDGAMETLSYLKQNGYKTGLVSNCGMETTMVWPRTSLSPFIDVLVFSCIEGTMKPEPRIFQIALEKLGVPPEACLYVADGMSQELTAASKLGMQAVRVEAPHDSEYEHDREDWRGLEISSLKEVLDLLK
jgi:putative hydrolase of the HAD superfamily